MSMTLHAAAANLLRFLFKGRRAER